MTKSLLYIIAFIFFLTVFISCEDILYVPDISKEEIMLVAPTNETNFYSTGVTFTWDKIDDAENYRLQIASPDFTNPVQIVLDTLISTTSFSQQLNIGKYAWRLKAVNSAYETAYKSRSFTIINNDDFQNNTPTLLIPANNLNTNISAQKLSWQTIIGATKYIVQIVDTDDILIMNDTISDSNITFTYPEGQYNWRVRASNGTEQTLFTTRSILVDYTVPNTPTLSSPVDKSTTTDKSICFKWNRTPISGSIEKDSLYIYKDSALTSLNLKKETSSSATLPLDSGTYYWFVKSFDKAGNTSDKSTVFSFTIN